MTFFEALFKKEFQNWKRVDAVQLPGCFDFAPLVQGLDENLSIISRFYYDVAAERCGAGGHVISERFYRLPCDYRVGVYRNLADDVVAVALYFSGALPNEDEALFLIGGL